MGEYNTRRANMATKKATKAEAPQEAANEATSFDEEVKAAKRLADIAGTGGSAFEGDLVTLDAIANQVVLLKDFKIMPSSFRQGGTYACMQIKLRSGKLIVVNNGGLVILKGLANMDKAANLPAAGKFVQVQGSDKTKKPYWNFENVD